MTNSTLVEQLNIPQQLIMEYRAIPLYTINNILYVAMSEPYNVNAIDDYLCITGLRIEPVLFNTDQITEMLQAYENQLGNSISEIKREGVGSEEEVIAGSEIISINKPPIAVLNDVNNVSVAEILEYILYAAVDNLASDIHIEPQEDCVLIRLRVDGMLREIGSLSINFKLPLLSRVKILAQLDIAEKRLPQDGRFRINVKQQKIDLRVSTIPTIMGEKCVLRLLYKDNRVADLNQLGFSGYNLNRLHQIIQRPYGMVLLTGPTGSGKTTTLYAVLRQLSSPEKNVITIENPVEFTLPGVNQIQINPQAGLTFANGLRSILRQDPDIIMVGEIRDRETAEIAVRAATTGHLVLSTIHTGDAAGALIRLIDMGIEPYLLASSILGVVSQRLVRVLCSACRSQYIANYTDKEKAFWGIKNKRAEIMFRATGCSHCDNIGYRGRTCISEVIPVSRRIKKVIVHKADEDEIKQLALEEGMLSMREDGYHKALQGITSMEEILRVSFRE